MKKKTITPASRSVKKDNTSVKAKVIKEIGPNYKYMGKMEKIKGKPSSGDSSTYREGFSAGMSEVSKNPLRKNRIASGPYKTGTTVVGLSSRYNEGFSEGKDKVLSRMKKK